MIQTGMHAAKDFLGLIWLAATFCAWLYAFTHALAARIRRFGYRPLIDGPAKAGLSPPAHGRRALMGALLFLALIGAGVLVVRFTGPW